SKFAEIINKAAFGKEIIGIERHNQVVAYIVPPEFTELIEDFEDRMAIKRAENEQSEPWESVKQELGLV
ncbi:MAG: hypothetical protein SFU25_11210, partial [Candidatus Caenarcaniphilales bacterium]|nr:hypothetical protein [Candidatus Caenarcaniphilales bacterium]